jgi:16S rRNA (guanine527-N7)-methyltransferase
MSGPWRALTDLRPGIDTALLDLYVAELVRWNKVIRLVGPRDAEGMARQVTDALLPFLHEPPVFPLLDVGSGAGLPAIPLAVAWPGERVVCLEPRDKRVSFLRHAARTLGLRSVEVVQGRSETACEENPGLSHAFACVTARAVADVATLLAWAEPFLAPGGRVILGRGGEGETRVPGWSLVRWRTYEGPEGVGLRAVAAYKREA